VSPLTVALQRGRKIVFTQAAIVQKGLAKFSQDLKMVCTLYKVPINQNTSPNHTLSCGGLSLTPCWAALLAGPKHRVVRAKADPFCDAPTPRQKQKKSG